MTDRRGTTSEDQWKFAEQAMRWHGWGSPVGLGIALVCLGLAAALIRFAVAGY